MTEPSNGSRSLRTKWLLAAVAIATLVGVFASMATSLAIRDLKASQHQVIDQLKALQEMVSSNRADMQRPSDEVAALQQIPPPAPSAPAPTGQKRGTR
jgi:L-cystine uptake protein TcyP (sodium:dicarboxylate symporter family)